MSVESRRGTAGQLRAEIVPSRRNSDLLAATPGMLRVGAGAYLRTVLWAADHGVKAARWTLETAVRPGKAPERINALATTLRDQARRALGVTEIEEKVRQMPDGRADGRGESIHALRAKGAELLARSAEVDDDDDLTHPAYERILTSLAPDEARILRLMALEGPRPAVDVRTWRPLDVGAETIEPGLTMIGPQAGVKHLDRVPAYLNNLYRLGLIWFSREPIDDQGAYQVLEAQPDVLAAMRRAGRAKTVRRSIRLTPFGIDFCEVCLPLDTASFLAVKHQLSNGSPDSAPELP